MTQSPSIEYRARWLVIEDESLVSMLIEEASTELGSATIGPANGVAKAIRRVETEWPTGPILDVNPGSEPVNRVADALRSRGVPLVFSRAMAKLAFVQNTSDIKCCIS